MNIKKKTKAMGSLLPNQFEPEPNVDGKDEEEEQDCSRRTKTLGEEAGNGTNMMQSVVKLLKQFEVDFT